MVRGIKEVLESETSPLWVENYAIHDDPPLNTGTRKGKHRLRVDIEFERCLRGKRPKYQFEAKRLYKSSSDTDYIGTSGMGCYFAGDDSYAKGHDEAGMLGYVQSEDEEYWQKRISDGLKKNSEQHRFDNRKQWTNLVFKEIKNKYIYTTTHKSQNDFMICHILLNFTVEKTCEPLN